MSTDNTSEKSRDNPAITALCEAEIRSRILATLNERRFKGRTLRGISTDANLDERVIRAAVANDQVLARKVKIVPILTKEGDGLLTTRDRFDAEATFKEKFVDFFATDRVTLGK